MDPRALGLADGRLHHVDEGGDVVVGDPLALGHRVDEGAVDVGGPGPAGGGGFGRHVTHLDPAVGGQQLHPQPHGEPGLVREELGHLLGCVARDHCETSSLAAGVDAPDPSGAGPAVADRAMSDLRCIPGQSMASTAR